MEEEILKSIQKVVDWLSIGYKQEDFKDTARRFYNYLLELAKGYDEEELKKIFSSSFPTKYNGMVVLRDITAYSICPHHLLPVIYGVDVIYIPTDKVLGLSKVVRAVRLIARQPLLQEDFTNLIVEKFNQYLQVEGVMVIVEGLHTCMLARGVKARSKVKTSQISGVFWKPEVKLEALDILKMQK
jgi:GTP cyclohydrolase I